MSSHSAMPERFAILAEFASADEALAAQDRLEAGGIATQLEVDAMAGWSWHDPAARPRAQLLVPEADYAEAARILAEITAGPAPRGSAAGDEPGWFCPKCDTEVEPFLDVCWACGTTRDGREDPEFEPLTSPDEPSLDRQGRAGAPDGRADDADRGPVNRRRGFAAAQYVHGSRPDFGPDFARDRRPDLDEILVRAWRTSVLGVLCLPPLLTFYSTWLVLKYFVLFDGVARRGHGRLYFALALNLVVLLVAGYVAHLQLTQPIAEPAPAAAVQFPDAPSPPHQGGEHRPR